MKALSKWLLLGLLLAAFVVVSTPVAMAQGPTPAPTAAQGVVTLTVYNPTGATEVTQTFAPRVADLNGKTICEISDTLWQYDRTFPLIQQLLQKQFPTAKFVTYDKFPALVTTDVPGLEDAVKGAGCQAVIVGNAG